jgi:hypothetical protein
MRIRGGRVEEAPVIIAPTITKLPGVLGAVVVTGSHGGIYPGQLAVAAGVRAVIFHDAGIGHDAAGVASLALLDRLGIAAAAVSHLSARVGDADDMMARGRISRANAAAAAVGVHAGLTCATAAKRLRAATVQRERLEATDERRSVTRPEGSVRALVLIDSASMVDPFGDRGAVVVTGSHGGLIGGDPARALGVQAFGAAYNDAGIGIDRAGIGRLPALDTRGIAALTVAAASARIGDARSTFEDGIISAVNTTAARYGAHVGERARAALLAWTRRPEPG